MGPAVGKKKRKRHLPVDPFEAFFNACMFNSAANALDMRKEQAVFGYPSIVNAALSVELCLKAVHLARRRREAAHGHSLVKLFDSLSRADKKSIESKYDECLAKHQLTVQALSAGFDVDLYGVLSRCDRLFEILRYWHERRPLQTDSNGKAGTAGLDSLFNALCLFSIELRPDWEHRFKERAGADLSHSYTQLPAGVPRVQPLEDSK